MKIELTEEMAEAVAVEVLCDLYDLTEDDAVRRSCFTILEQLMRQSKFREWTGGYS